MSNHYTLFGAAASVGILGIMLGILALALWLLARRREKIARRKYAEIYTEHKPVFDQLKEDP